MGCTESKSDHKKQYSKTMIELDPFQSMFLELEVQQDRNQIRIHTTASTDNINSYFNIGKPIGHGTYGIVRIGTEKSTDNKNKKYAIKSVAKMAIKDKLWMLKRELDVMRQLDHPNIIQFYEIFQDPLQIHFVMEYCGGGDLLNYIFEKSLSEQQAARIIFKLFSAINHLHQKNIVHRDIKLENILFTENPKNQNSEVKMIDFGLSIQYNQKPKRKQSFVGTPVYCAPEIHRNLEYNSKIDTWALGVILYAVLSGTYPFVTDEQGSFVEKVVRGNYNYNDPIWSGISQQAKNFIDALLCIDQNKRLSSEDALKNEWFQIQYLEKSKQKYEQLLPQTKPILQNLIHFQSKNMIRRQALQVLINHELSREDLNQLTEAFKTLDIDKTGQIHLKDMIHAMEKSGIKIDNEHQLLKVFKEIHQENNIQLNQHQHDENVINYSEFMQAALNMNEYLSIQKLWHVFIHFDSDNTGYLDLENFKNYVAREGRVLSPQEEEEMKREVGHNLNFIDFCKYVNADNTNLQQSIIDYSKNNKSFEQFIKKQQTISEHIDKEEKKSQESEKYNLAQKDYIDERQVQSCNDQSSKGSSNKNEYSSNHKQKPQINENSNKKSENSSGNKKGLYYNTSQ